MTNPLLAQWTDHYGLPPHDRIRPEHFAPAYDAAFRAHTTELDAIANAAEPATFDNTIAAYDRAGRLLMRIQNCFNNLASSDTNAALQAVEREIAPKEAAHRNSIFLNEKLFARVDDLYQRRATLGLTPVQLRLLERIHLDFSLAGASLVGDARQQFAANAERLATLQTEFSQRVLHDEAHYLLEVADETSLAGVPAWLKASAEAAAIARGCKSKYAFNASRSVVESFLAFAENRELRKTLFEAFRARGRMNADATTLPIIIDILKLRHAQAQLMGYANFADYALADTMAQKPAAVAALMQKIWSTAKVKAKAEYDSLKPYAKKDGIDAIEAWDWRYYAEKLRQDRYAVSDDEVKPYFSLDAMTRAMFDCAGRLFGIRFDQKSGAPLHHPDATLYEVRRLADNSLVGHFITDNFARESKRSGAWMSYLREQSRSAGVDTPIVLNTNNFPKPPAGQQALLGFDEVRTLFHEFGHGLHGLLSNSEFVRLSGTNVLADFVELPSQVFEHWGVAPEVMRLHAKHVQTGQPIPETLIAKLKRAEVVNQGLEAVEAASSVLIDQALHQRVSFDGLDVLQFERDVLAQIGMPAHMKPRHELPHFGHLFSGDYYASKYYVYLWAEVLDADAFVAFEEVGDVFDPALAKKLYTHVYSAGNTVPPQETYRAFRGRDPRVEAMLIKRGLAQVEPEIA